MRFEWDPAKAEANLRKHGVSFELAPELFADFVLFVPDLSVENEVRWRAFGRIGAVVMPLVYTDREVDLIRIISMRHALRYEQREYWQVYPQ